VSAAKPSKKNTGKTPIRRPTGDDIRLARSAIAAHLRKHGDGSFYGERLDDAVDDALSEAWEKWRGDATFSTYAVSVAAGRAKGDKRRVAKERAAHESVEDLLSEPEDGQQGHLVPDALTSESPEDALVRMAERRDYEEHADEIEAEAAEEQKRRLAAIRSAWAQPVLAFIRDNRAAVYAMYRGGAGEAVANWLRAAIAQRDTVLDWPLPLDWPGLLSPQAKRLTLPADFVSRLAMYVDKRLGDDSEPERGPGKPNSRSLLPLQRRDDAAEDVCRAALELIGVPRSMVNAIDNKQRARLANDLARLTKNVQVETVEVLSDGSAVVAVSRRSTEK
jgi:hypothetical protein